MYFRHVMHRLDKVDKLSKNGEDDLKNIWKYLKPRTTWSIKDIDIITCFNNRFISKIDDILELPENEKSGLEDVFEKLQKCIELIVYPKEDLTLLSRLVDGLDAMFNKDENEERYIATSSKPYLVREIFFGKEVWGRDTTYGRRIVQAVALYLFHKICSEHDMVRRIAIRNRRDNVSYIMAMMKGALDMEYCKQKISDTLQCLGDDNINTEINISVRDFLLDYVCDAFRKHIYMLGRKVNNMSEITKEEYEYDIIGDVVRSKTFIINELCNPMCCMRYLAMAQNNVIKELYPNGSVPNELYLDYYMSDLLNRDLNKIHEYSSLYDKKRSDCISARAGVYAYELNSNLSVKIMRSEGDYVVLNGVKVPVLDAQECCMYEEFDNLMMKTEISQKWKSLKYTVERYLRDREGGIPNILVQLVCHNIEDEKQQTSKVSPNKRVFMHIEERDREKIIQVICLHILYVMCDEREKRESKRLHCKRIPTLNSVLDVKYVHQCITSIVDNEEHYYISKAVLFFEYMIENNKVIYYSAIQDCKLITKFKNMRDDIARFLCEPLYAMRFFAMDEGQMDKFFGKIIQNDECIISVPRYFDKERLRKYIIYYVDMTKICDRDKILLKSNLFYENNALRIKPEPLMKGNISYDSHISESTSSKSVYCEMSIEDELAFKDKDTLLIVPSNYESISDDWNSAEQTSDDELSDTEMEVGVL